MAVETGFMVLSLVMFGGAYWLNRRAMALLDEANALHDDASAILVEARACCSSVPAVQEPQ